MNIYTILDFTFLCTVLIHQVREGERSILNTLQRTLVKDLLGGQDEQQQQAELEEGDNGGAARKKRKVS